MARARRRQTAALIDLLTREPDRFDSRQALRVLEARARRQGAAPVAFRSSLSLSFPVGDIESVDIPNDARAAPTVTVSFLGLGGATGPLPTPYTEHLGAAVRRRDPAGRDFLDIFNHRLVTAAMDMAKLYRPALQPGPPHQSNVARQCQALLGLGTPGLPKRMAGLAPSLLPLTALLNQRPLSAHAIERAIAAHFHVAARVVPFRGDWLRVPLDQRSVIGAKGRNRILGRSAMLGGRVWQQDAGIVLELGPMTAAEAETLLPSVSSARPTRHADLVALLDVLAEDSIDIAIRLLVQTASVPLSRLGDARALRLGWSAWLTRDARARQDPVRLGQASARLAKVAGAGAGPHRLGGATLPAISIVTLRTQPDARE